MAFTLRQESHPGFTTATGALTYKQGDDNFTGLYDRDNLRLSLTGGTLTGGLDISSGNFDVASGQILSGGTDIATLWGGGGGGATNLNGLTDAYVSGTNLFLGNDPSGTISGTLNHAVGVTALEAITSGDRNTAFGNDALSANQSGANNTAIGGDALKLCTNSENTAVGSRAGMSLVSHTKNTLIGRGAGELATSSFNTCVGYNAGAAAMTNGYNTLIGAQAGDVLTSGQQNVFVGVDSGGSVNTGSRNTLLGYATNAHAGSEDSIAIGRGMTITANDTLVVGGFPNNVLLHGEFGTASQTKLGINLGNAYSAPTATLHVKGGGTAFADVAMLITDSNDVQIMKLTADGRNAIIGHDAGINLNAGGMDNILLGFESGINIINGTNNVLIGKQTKSKSSATHNIIVGEQAGSINSGSGNILFGRLSGWANNNGHHNIAMGHDSAAALTSGSYNILLGYSSGGVVATGSNNIVIGKDLDVSGAGVSDELNIGGQIIGNMDSAGDRYTKFVGQTYSELYDMGTITGAAVTPSLRNGNVQKATISGVCNASTFPNDVKAGSTFILMLEQATGADTISAWNAGYKFPGGVAPTLSTSVGAIDVITCIAISSTEAVVTSSLDH